jgi:hypothetical protein
MYSVYLFLFCALSSYLCLVFLQYSAPQRVLQYMSTSVVICFSTCYLVSLLYSINLTLFPHLNFVELCMSTTSGLSVFLRSVCLQYTVCFDLLLVCSPVLCLHCKKKLATFPSPAGMSLTKHPCWDGKIAKPFLQCTHMQYPPIQHFGCLQDLCNLLQPRETDPAIQLSIVG